MSVFTHNTQRCCTGPFYRIPTLTTLADSPAEFRAYRTPFTDPAPARRAASVNFLHVYLAAGSLSTAANLPSSQELGTDSFCTSRRFGGWDSDRIRNSHSEFSELTRLSRIPESLHAILLISVDFRLAEIL